MGDGQGVPGRPPLGGEVAAEEQVGVVAADVVLVLREAPERSLMKGLRGKSYIAFGRS